MLDDMQPGFGRRSSSVSRPVEFGEFGAPPVYRCVAIVRRGDFDQNHASIAIRRQEFTLEGPEAEYHTMDESGLRQPFASEHEREN